MQDYTLHPLTGSLGVRQREYINNVFSCLIPSPWVENNTAAYSLQIIIICQTPSFIPTLASFPPSIQLTFQDCIQLCRAQRLDTYVPVCLCNYNQYPFLSLSGTSVLQTCVNV